jgi:hypothetical protein
MRKRIKLNNAQERLFSTTFSFIILVIGVYGYLVDSYTDRNNPLLPNVLNTLFNREIIPDEHTMFVESYYVNDSITYVNVQGRTICVLDSSHEKDNMISGSWLYMIIMFLPIFIISILDLKVDKITRKGIVKCYMTFLRYRNE